MPTNISSPMVRVCILYAYCMHIKYIACTYMYGKLHMKHRTYTVFSCQWKGEEIRSKGTETKYIYINMIFDKTGICHLQCTSRRLYVSTNSQKWTHAHIYICTYMYIHCSAPKSKSYVTVVYLLCLQHTYMYVCMYMHCAYRT